MDMEFEGFEKFMNSGFSLDLESLRNVPAGRRTEDVLTDLEQVQKEIFLERIRDVFGDEKLAEQILKSPAMSTVPRGMLFNDFNETYRLLGKALAEIVAERSESDVSPVAATYSNVGWKDEVRGILQTEKEGHQVLLVVFGNKILGLEEFKKAIELDEKWQVMHEPIQGNPPYKVDEKGLVVAVGRTLCIARP